MIERDTYVNATSDGRVVNNTARHQYRTLNEAEKAEMAKVKDMGLDLLEVFEELGDNREIAIARSRLEEAVMWAVKAITK